MKKRFLSVLIAAAMVLSLAACGSSSASSSEASSASSASSAVSEASSASSSSEASSAVSEASSASSASSTSSVSEASSESADGTRVVTDMLGREVELPAEINSIATFKAIGVLNTLVETMGYGDKIVNGMTAGFTKGSHDMQYVFAPQIKDAPVLENNDGDILIEEVLALDPDLCVVAWEDGVDLLEEAGMTVVYVNWTTGDELKEAVTLMGEVLNAQDVAQEYCEYFDNAVSTAEALTADIAEDEKVKALYGSVTGLKNPHKISNWWIQEAGGISVTAELAEQTDGESVEYSTEDLLAWNPDVIFTSSNEKDDILADTNLAGVTAVANQAIYKVPTVGHSWGNRSTEQPLVILWAMSKMYPDLYPADTFKEEVINFYETFMGVTLTDEQYDKYIG